MVEEDFKKIPAPGKVSLNLSKKLKNQWEHSFTLWTICACAGIIKAVHILKR